MLALQNLIQDRGRLLGSMGGVGLSVALILVLLAIVNGIIDQYTNYARHLNADIFVAQRGSTTMLQPSLLDAATQEQVASVDGVGQTAPLYGQIITLRAGQRDHLAYLIGYDTDLQLGGPWAIASGSGAVGPGEAVMDGILAEQLGLRAGDNVVLPDRLLHVGGTASETNFRYSYVFVDRRDAAQMLGLPSGRFSFLLVRVRPGAEARQVADAINRAVPQVSAYTRAEFVQNAVTPLENTVLPTLRIMFGVGAVAGTIVIGLTVYAAVMERLKEYATLKAVGADALHLYRVTLQQALLSVGLGFVVGLALTMVLALIFPRLERTLAMRLDPGSILFGLALATGMGVLAAFVPVWRLVRLDPAVAFRA